MQAKEKAIDLVEKYKPLVYPYLGSGMLANELNEGVILMNAKACAIIAVDEIIESHLDVIWHMDSKTTNVEYWQQVKQEINSL